MSRCNARAAAIPATAGTSNSSPSNHPHGSDKGTWAGTGQGVKSRGRSVSGTHRQRSKSDAHVSACSPAIPNGTAATMPSAAKCGAGAPIRFACCV